MKSSISLCTPLVLCCVRKHAIIRRHARISRAIYKEAFHSFSNESNDLAQSGSQLVQADKLFENIPGPSSTSNSLDFYVNGQYSIEKYHKALLERHRIYGPIFKDTVNGHTKIHIFDPALSQIIYQNDGKMPHIPPLLKSSEVYRKKKNMSLGLGLTNGEEWYRLRSAVQQMMMRNQAVSVHLPHIQEVAVELVQTIKARRNICTGVVEKMNNLLLRWTLESSTLICFSRRLDSLDSPSNSFQQKLIDAMSEIFKLSMLLKFSKETDDRNQMFWNDIFIAEDFFFGEAQKLVDSTIRRIQEKLESGSLEKTEYPFLVYLMSKKSLSYKDVSIIALSLFGDGLSTTAPCMAGQLYCLANNPGKQETLRQEILSTGALELEQMPYLRACIKEGFRFFPVGVEVSRILQKEVSVSGYLLPAGTCVEMNSNLLLQDDKYFENPALYLPERWLRQKDQFDQPSVHPYLLQPFSIGPRMCAGRRFAEQQMSTLLCELLKNFRLEWNSAASMDQNYNILLVPDTDCSVSFYEY